jgi:hypothetical protein
MRGIDVVHDASLLVWAVRAAARAGGWTLQAGPVDALLITVNLVSGAPAAWRRAREGRRDLVAWAAPVAVGCAVVTTARPRPRWAPVAATSALLGLRAIERSRRT